MTATLHPKARPVARTRALWILGATAATGAIWAAARGLGADLTVSDQAVSLPAVIVTTALVGLAAWALLAVLERATRRGGTIWTWVAVAVLLLSLAGPLGAETAGGTATLLAMHLAAAAVLVPGLRRTAAGSGRPATP